MMKCVYFPNVAACDPLEAAESRIAALEALALELAGILKDDPDSDRESRPSMTWDEFSEKFEEWQGRRNAALSSPLLDEIRAKEASHG